MFTREKNFFVNTFALLIRTCHGEGKRMRSPRREPLGPHGPRLSDGSGIKTVRMANLIFRREGRDWTRSLTEQVGVGTALPFLLLDWRPRIFRLGFNLSRFSRAHWRSKKGGAGVCNQTEIESACLVCGHPKHGQAIRGPSSKH